MTSAQMRPIQRENLVFKNIFQYSSHTFTAVFHEHAIPDSAVLRRVAEVERSVREMERDTRNPLLTSAIYKVGKCLPAECSAEDVSIGGRNFLVSETLGRYNLSSNISTLVLSCHPTLEDETKLEAGDYFMIALLIIFALLIVAGSVLDVGVNVLQIKYLPKQYLGVMQGFSAYHNSRKILSTGASGDLACINGLKYISISWIVLGHVLWEYCNVSSYGAFTLSAGATGQATDSVAATVMWNGLIGVDTFFVIGGCLLAFHTMKELDKTRGGNCGMWLLFYVHRYLRLTGVYSIIIALHATLLRFAASGPQAHLVTALADKCQTGWWLNILYINNFAADIYGAGEADCINVSWYMAIDMQYFLLTPGLLSLVWWRPRLGFSLTGLLLTAGTASQIAFTVLDDEFFHGGFSYYVKPWNRSQPYLVGLLLGILLHKVSSVLRHTVTSHRHVSVMVISVEGLPQAEDQLPGRHLVLDPGRGGGLCRRLRD